MLRLVAYERIVISNNFYFVTEYRICKTGSTHFGIRNSNDFMHPDTCHVLNVVVRDVAMLHGVV